jgi:hypothetical protein
MACEPSTSSPTTGKPTNSQLRHLTRQDELKALTNFERLVCARMKSPEALRDELARLFLPAEK